MRRPLLCLTTVLAGPLLAATAHAGAYLENVEKELEGTKAPATSKMWFDSGRMRMERAENNDTTVVILKNQTMYTISEKTKSYGVIDKATVEQLGATMAAARKQMEARMASMPPEQRKKMEEMMAKLGQGSGPKPQRTLQKTGRTESAAGLKCTVWEVLEDGKKEEEICAAPTGSLPNGEEMIKTFRDLAAMFKSFTESLGGGGMDNALWQDLDTINGVPIITREFSEGKARSEMRLTVARKESVPASSFEVPAGYTEKKLPIGKPGGPGAD